MAHHAKSAAQGAARVYDCPMYVYPCPHCLGFHLTRVNPKLFGHSQDQVRNRKRARIPVGGLA